MRLEGIHHITAITADGQRNIDFYASLLGLRLVKKTVNQDDPLVYHLFYGDEQGSPGLDLTFFVYPGAAPGRAGAGMAHRIDWRVADRAALEFWRGRLEAAGVRCESGEGRLDFHDHEGLSHRLVAGPFADPPLRAAHPEIPEACALLGFAGVRAYAAQPQASAGLLTGALAFEGGPDLYQVRGETRSAAFAFDPPPTVPGRSGAGSVHHVAFACQPDQIELWRERLARAGAAPTAVIDRFYFRSVYFRIPAGVLFELATIGPGFARDEHPDHLGEQLALPPFLEHRRAELEAALPPLANPRVVAGPAR